MSWSATLLPRGRPRSCESLLWLELELEDEGADGDELDLRRRHRLRREEDDASLDMPGTHELEEENELERRRRLPVPKPHQFVHFCTSSTLHQHKPPYNLLVVVPTVVIVTFAVHDAALRTDRSCPGFLGAGTVLSVASPMHRGLSGPRFVVKFGCVGPTECFRRSLSNSSPCVVLVGCALVSGPARTLRRTTRLRAE